MDFSDALRAVKDGKRVRRVFWQELSGRVGTWVELTQPGPCANGLQLSPLLVCLVTNKEPVLFACSQFDILAEDWEIVESA